MNSFKQAAIKVLTDSNKPLHYREITQQALDKDLIKSDGKTPWATMNAQLVVDIIKNGQNSPFRRAQPGFYMLNGEQQETFRKTISAKARIVKHQVTPELGTKQKGDICEARVAELLALYGNEGLTCYKPISDDEGIDLIVKRRGKLDVVYIQVKSSFGYKERGFVSTVKDKNIINKERQLIVFVYFDLSEGDLFDQVFVIPAPDFLRLTNNEDKKQGQRVFTVALNHPERSKYAEFMIEKRELANRVIEIMDKL